MNSTGNTADGTASVNAIVADGPDAMGHAVNDAAVDDRPDNGGNEEAMGNDDSDELFPSLNQIGKP